MSEEKVVKAPGGAWELAPALEVLASDPRLPVNESALTLFADFINVQSRSDGISQLRFFSKVPGKNLELARIMITRGTMARLKEIFEKHLVATEAPPDAKSAIQSVGAQTPPAAP